jgi:hypothetical protein
MKRGKKQKAITIERVLEVEPSEQEVQVHPAQEELSEQQNEVVECKSREGTL